MNTLQLARKYPQAWEALPEAYREDNVLEFKVEDARLTARPLPEHRQYIGDWIAVWDSDPDFGGWYDAATKEYFDAY